MFRKTTALAARQRITPCAHRTLRQNLFNTETVFDKEVEEDLGWMTTYSAFDPCSSRPLPFPMQSSMVIQMPTTFLESTIPKTLRVMKDTIAEKEEVTFKPWPYSLPLFLQPKDDTTFSLMNSTTTTSASDTYIKRTDILQAILYGVPDPERFSYRRELVAPGSLLHKIFYGVKEMDDGEGVVAVANVTAVRVEDEAIGEDKVGKETNVVVVKNVEVKVEVENVMEKNDDMGQGMIAK